MVNGAAVHAQRPPLRTAAAPEVRRRFIMRPDSLLLPILLAPAIAAQSIEIWPGTTSFTTRGQIATLAGEVHQGFHSDYWKGIGDHVTGLTINTQDRQAATQEPYGLVLRTGTNTSGPTAGINGEMCVVLGLMTPLGVGITSWQITTSFFTPCRIPAKGFFSAGVRLAANAGYPGTDGQSVHSSDFNVQQSRPDQGDHAWVMVGTNAATNFLSKRSLRIRIHTDAPILQNSDFAWSTGPHSRGMGGMFPPDVTHGFSTHVDGGPTFASGFTSVFMSLGACNPPIVVPGIQRGLYIYCGGPIFQFPVNSLNTNGAADIPLFGPIGSNWNITVYLQAVVVNSNWTTLTWTNVNATRFFL